ncbi:MAG TPA: asparagine synthase-related protein [Pyrinomonadaceae bacterium]|nr:asparagine synthase-related protein [Pyrinomonadaceae bacterium]
MNTQELSLVGGRGRPGGRVEVLHWDGRLDNRDDLLLRLGDSLRGDTGNAAIAGAAYERWGADGLVHLVGDWSAVISDKVNRATVLASDFAGVRPLYYHVRAGRVLWSSRLQSLVEATGISELDEQYVAGFLTFGGCPNRTPYKGIHSVPPGHAVRVSSEGTSLRRFWELPFGDEIRYREQRRYEEQLRALFREAVAVRMQTASPVLAELSGGLDSSSVVCMANRLMRSGAVGAPSLTGLSFVWRDSLDEPFIREVESYCGIEGVHVSTHDVPPVSETQAGDAMPEAFRPLRESVAATASRLGAKTILTGQNGDLMMGNWFDDSLQVAASLRRFRPGRACEEALAWSKVLRLPVYRVLWRAFRAALPPALAPAALYATPDGSYVPRNVETSLAAGFSDRTGLCEPGGGFSDAWMQAPPERRKYFRVLSMMLELRQLQPCEPLQHLDYTHPFAHRPLVEFLMAVPPDVLCRPGEPRRLMRSAFSDLWPVKLRGRRSKGLFNAPWQEALRPLARAILKDRRLQLAERGFVDLTSALSRMERLAAGLECNEAQLRQVILLELWLRNRAGDGRSGQVPRAA